MTKQSMECICEWADKYPLEPLYLKRMASILGVECPLVDITDRKFIWNKDDVEYEMTIQVDIILLDEWIIQ